MAAARRKKIEDVRPELPRQPQVGDRIKLKEGEVRGYTEVCERVGWSFDPFAIRVVTREDKFNPGGGRRLFFEGAPFCFGAHDVELAWNTEDERREMLQRQGWKV